jgi:hypothetical protein
MRLRSLVSPARAATAIAFKKRTGFLKVSRLVIFLTRGRTAQNSIGKLAK